MTDCNSCIHAEICCKFRSFEVQRYIKENKDDCPKFKDKSYFTELPFKVGETAYLAESPIIQKVTIAAIHFTLNKNRRNQIAKNHIMVYIPSTMFNSRIWWDKIESTLFHTYEEAEKAVKEREENRS